MPKENEKGKVPKNRARAVPVPCALLSSLSGRIAVLGGSREQRVGLLLGLARQQREQGGRLVCVDGQGEKKTEAIFRLLFRSCAVFLPVSVSSLRTVGETLLQEVGFLLQNPDPPPLVLFNGVPWVDTIESAVAFLLHAGVVVVEFWLRPEDLPFGRHDAVLLLWSRGGDAHALSRSVGRRVAPEEILALGPNEGLLVRLTHILPVRLPHPPVTV